MTLNNSTSHPIYGFYCAIYLCGHLKLFDCYIYFKYLLSKTKFCLHKSAGWGKKHFFCVWHSASVLEISLTMALNSLRKPDNHATGQKFPSF